MIEIKYISSNTKKYNLIGDRLRATSGNFHSYEWKRKTKISKKSIEFEKDAASYQITLTLRGNLAERKKMLDDLIDSFEYDIQNKTPGKICFGEYYIEGYIIKANSKTSSIRNEWSDCDIEIYCPYPFWIKETEYNFKTADITSTDNKKYGYRYGFRYANGLKDTYIINDSFTSVHFKMRIYGPCVNPLVNIGGHSYTVHTILQEGEYLEIDSMEETAIKTMMNGTKVNMFHYRGNGVFTKILPGRQVISWDGKFDFDIVMFIERSEPKWVSDRL